MPSQSEHCSVVSDSLRPHELYSSCNSPGQNTGVGSLSLLQGIFPTQGSNPGLPHCRRILYQLSYEGSPVWPNQAPHCCLHLLALSPFTTCSLSTQDVLVSQWLCSNTHPEASTTLLTFLWASLFASAQRSQSPCQSRSVSPHINP